MPLTPEQKALVQDIVDRFGDPIKLLLVYHRAVFRAARVQFDVDDIRQLCWMGVIEAALRFQPEKGQFFSYAVLWIRSKVGTATASRRLRESPFQTDSVVGEFDGKTLTQITTTEEPERGHYAESEAAELFAHLPKKWQAVLHARYGTDGTGRKTLREVATRYGVTRAAIWDTERRAIALLRQKIWRRL